jgi:hypothetical protein
LLSFPTGFSVGLPTEVVVHGMDGDGTPWRKAVDVGNESAFLRELVHFHACIVDGAPNETPGEEAIADVALVRDVILSARRGAVR